MYLSRLSYREEGSVRLRIEIQPSILAFYLLPEHEVDGCLTCFPWSVHKLLGCSNEDARFRLQEMANGPYYRPAIMEKLKGTGVSLTELKHHGAKKNEKCSCDTCTALKLEALREPGNYIIGKVSGIGHVIGVHVLDDGSLRVHDNLCRNGVGQFSPSAIKKQPDNYRVWRLGTTITSCTTSCEQEGAHQQDRGRLITKISIDTENTTWAEALQAAYPDIQKAIVHQEHRRSTHLTTIMNSNGKPTGVEYDPDFVDDTVPAKHAFSNEAKEEALSIHLGENLEETGIEVLQLEEQDAYRQSLRSLSQRVLEDRDFCRDGTLCSTAEVRIPWSRGTPTVDVTQQLLDQRNVPVSGPRRQPETPQPHCTTVRWQGRQKPRRRRRRRRPEPYIEMSQTDAMVFQEFCCQESRSQCESSIIEASVFLGLFSFVQVHCRNLATFLRAHVMRRFCMYRDTF